MSTRLERETLSRILCAEDGGFQLKRSSISNDSKLKEDLGIESDQGIDLVLQMGEAFGVRFPDDFNPVIHESGERSRTFGELVEYTESFLAKEN
ncbi:acyl carrier protein [Calycomorphotria hydatis]|uniref:Acyl carrier protein n=1 Tax=Calycomorphotria hydatis TaxID=2528027 RepID=A0A517TDP1_9PLAN|nr:hypothetical protein [Calycomorphotria hydatis]QDT66482.1 acyl carrier protein [Calycomorphotria hydatis]